MWSQKLKIYGIEAQSIVDGPGFRFAIFTQGCPHHCKGCHNPESQNLNGGKFITLKEIKELFEKYNYVNGITFSGGEPFLQSDKLSFLADYFHSKDKDIICYTGFTLQELQNSDDKFVKILLGKIDLLIDGRFVESKRDLSLRYRGSSNQNLIPLTEKGNRLLEY
ncbi:MAG: anaerobic ribonucleoside-triphosphate reductase activating protein [Tissierellia bacterium]|nr:anaerobic ribonucleoside-triphosphate reductase activating protein [Tissierellia bacterium]